jgi:hypothetical protein
MLCAAAAPASGAPDSQWYDMHAYPIALQGSGAGGPAPDVGAGPAGGAARLPQGRREVGCHRHRGRPPGAAAGGPGLSAGSCSVLRFEQLQHESQVLLRPVALGLRTRASLPHARILRCWWPARKAPRTHLVLLVLQDRLRFKAHRSLPTACRLCSGTERSAAGCPNLYHTSLQVFHGASSMSACDGLAYPISTKATSSHVVHCYLPSSGLWVDSCWVPCTPPRLSPFDHYTKRWREPLPAVDLLPSRLKLQIFVDMPWRIRLATIAAPLQARHAHTTT